PHFINEGVIFYDFRSFYQSFFAAFGTFYPYVSGIIIQCFLVCILVACGVFPKLHTYLYFILIKTVSAKRIKNKKIIPAMYIIPMPGVCSPCARTNLS